MNLQKLILASTWQGTIKSLSVCLISIGSQSNMWVAVKNNYFQHYYSLVILRSLQKWYTLVSVWLPTKTPVRTFLPSLAVDCAVNEQQGVQHSSVCACASPPRRCHPWWPGSGWQQQARPAQCPWCICWSHRWRNHILAALGPCPCKTQTLN